MLEYMDAVTLLECSDARQLRNYRRSVTQLLQELNGKSPRISQSVFLRCLRDTHNRFSFAISDGAVVGMAQAAIYQTFKTWKVWLEDVVVSDACRSEGVGRELLRHLYSQIDLPADEAVEWVLTNRPERGSSGFYRRLSFQSVDTTVFTTTSAELAQQLFDE